MITDSITKQIGEALKAHDEVCLSTLRMLSSALNYEFIAKQHKLSEDEELVVVKREAKKRKDAIEAYEKVGAKERAEKEEKELVILEKYLPEEMSDTELQALVKEAIKETQVTEVTGLGKVMAVVMDRARGKVSGDRASALVKSLLSAK